MSFEIKDLSVSLSYGDEGAPQVCTTMTVPVDTQISLRGESAVAAVRSRNLSLLRQELRQAAARA